MADVRGVDTRTGQKGVWTGTKFVPDQPLSQPVKETSTIEDADGGWGEWLKRELLKVPSKPPTPGPPLPMAEKLRQMRAVGKEIPSALAWAAMGAPERQVMEELKARPTKRPEPLKILDLPTRTRETKYDPEQQRWGKVVERAWPGLKLEGGQSWWGAFGRSAATNMMAGVAREGVDPMTYITAFGAQKIIPIVGKAVWAKLSPATQASLAKQRSLLNLLKKGKRRVLGKEMLNEMDELGRSMGELRRVNPQAASKLEARMNIDKLTKGELKRYTMGREAKVPVGRITPEAEGIYRAVGAQVWKPSPIKVSPKAYNVDSPKGMFKVKVVKGKYQVTYPGKSVPSKSASSLNAATNLISAAVGAVPVEEEPLKFSSSLLAEIKERTSNMDPVDIPEEEQTEVALNDFVNWYEDTKAQGLAESKLSAEDLRVYRDTQRDVREAKQVLGVIEKRKAPPTEAEIVHTMPDGTLMPGPEHAGSKPGSTQLLPTPTTNLKRGDQITWISKTKGSPTSGTIVHITPKGDYLTKTEEGLRTIKPDRAILPGGEEAVARLARAQTQVRRIGAAQGAVGEGDIATIAVGPNGYIVVKAPTHAEAKNQMTKGGPMWETAKYLDAGTGELRFVRARVDELGQLRSMPDEPIVQDEIDNIISGKPGRDPIEPGEIPIPPGPPVVPGETPGEPPTPEPSSELMSELPKLGGFKSLIVRMHKVLDIEAPFRALGKPETGKAVKRIPGEVTTHLVRLSKLVLKTTRMGNKTGLAKSDFEDMLYISAQPSLLKELPKEVQKVYEPILKEFRDYLTDYERIHKEVGTFDVEWPKVQKMELAELIKESEAALKSPDMTPNREEALRETINNARGALKFLNDEDIKYVPITWFDKLFQESPKEAARILNRFYAKRETVDIRALGQHLLDKGIIERADLDIRTVLAGYALDSGKKIALGKWINAMIKDGLVKTVDVAPKEWPKLPPGVFKELVGYRVHPYAYDSIMAYKDTIGSATTLRKVIAFTKLLQFTKFWFLAMYDTYEGVVSGALLSPRLPLTIYRSAKSLLTRDKHLSDMYQYNAFSQPVTLPREMFIKDMEKLEKWGNFPSIALDFIKENLWVGETIPKKLKHLPLGALELAYLPIWFASWFGDRFMRGVGYHHLLSKGWSPDEAGDMTAEIFSDYGAVPTKTRRNVAQVFFTYPFFITMMKAQSRMLLSPFKLMTKEGRAGTEGKKNRFRAAMLMRLLMGLVTMDVIWRSLGYRRDRYGTKYTKTVKDERGVPKELVVSTPHPYNVIWRRYHGLTNLPKYGDQWKAWTNSAKWQLTPMWRNTVMMLTNQKADHTPITSRLFKDPQKRWEDMTIFGVRETIKIIDDIASIGEDGTRQEATRAFQQDLGPFWSKVLGPFSNAYLRGLPEGRMAYKMRALKQAAEKFMSNEVRGNPELMEQFRRNLDERMKEVVEEFEKEKGGRR